MIVNSIISLQLGHDRLEQDKILMDGSEFILCSLIQTILS